jgi:hypothetical protein
MLKLTQYNVVHTKNVNLVHLFPKNKINLNLGNIAIRLKPSMYINIPNLVLGDLLVLCRIKIIIDTKPLI